MTTLLRVVPPLVALWGWACLALSVTAHGPLVALALVGFVASIAARRKPVGSAIVEGIALVVLAGLGSCTSRWSFVIVGAVLVVAAGTTTEVARRHST